MKDTFRKGSFSDWNKKQGDS